MKEILLNHAAAYPLMQPTDAVKLIYQATFGGGHLIKNQESALENLRAEYSKTSHEGTKLHAESLCETSRIYLDSALTEDELTLIAKVFCVSAKHYSVGYDSADEETKSRFHSRLELLQELCRDGNFSFTPSKLDEYLDSYSAANYPPVSHSEVYRNAYKPTYRVIDSRYVRLIDTMKAISATLKTAAERTVIAIDGKCASGKTTAAKLICEIFGGEIIHMDDFFLPPEMRTAERISEIGGNLHRERFWDEVIPNLKSNAPFSYRVFDCSKMSYSDAPRKIGECNLIICEGSYSLHPSFGKYYDIAVFSDIENDEQIERIRLRDGEYMLSRFINEWITMENKYFDTFKIKEKCHFII